MNKKYEVVWVDCVDGEPKTVTVSAPTAQQAAESVAADHKGCTIRWVGSNGMTVGGWVQPQRGPIRDMPHGNSCDCRNRS